MIHVRSLLAPVAVAAAAASAQSHDHAHGGSGQAKPSAPAVVPAPPLPARRAEIPAREPRATLPDYRPYRDEPALPWRAANDQVRETGGHGGAMKATTR